MSLNYEFRPLEGLSQEGKLASLFVKDENAICTIKKDHAPLMMMIQNGSVDLVFLDGSKQHIQVTEGLLYCQDNLCKINVLK